ncbi:MAG: putative membrane protein [Roseibaca calidilacus]|uniref:Putative membrane protein n=1 Tax=Roseibaca calidilacus TaxID=1666912 RepID=A0A0P7YHI0_9RHOB|nr:MAPEG family protein [Roseibaca calidilacus]KPP89827.1 MAG: putative membrane protein [Roseibaca calidilacus]CUX80826.1 Uncharacterized conserved protein, MAPEG superfamily [Roseibaca calidilacus]
MSVELTCLALAGLLWAAQLAHLALRANLEIGSRYFLSPRDTDPPQPLSPGTARLKRAYQNHHEALLLFAVAIAVLTLADKESAVTASLAVAYLLARTLFVPAYLLGWSPLRSVFFGIGYLCSILLLVLALL